MHPLLSELRSYTLLQACAWAGLLMYSYFTPWGRSHVAAVRRVVRANGFGLMAVTAICVAIIVCRVTPTEGGVLAALLVSVPCAILVVVQLLPKRVCARL